MNWDEMNNLYRGPSIDASYQVSYLWPSGFRDGMSTLYRGPPIDVSYQVSVHLAKPLQRRRFKKIGGCHRKFLFLIG
jgi:hypothetical protein